VLTFSFLIPENLISVVYWSDQIVESDKYAWHDLLFEAYNGAATPI